MEYAFYNAKMECICDVDSDNGNYWSRRSHVLPRARRAGREGVWRAQMMNSDTRFIQGWFFVIAAVTAAILIERWFSGAVGLVASCCYLIGRWSMR